MVGLVEGVARMNRIKIIALALLLAGCGNRSAGLTELEARTELDENGKIKSCYTKFTDGKERDGGVTASGTICGHPFSYSTGSERAFRAFEIEAEARKVSIEILGRVVPEVVGAALSAYTGTAALGAVSDAVAAKAALDAARLKAEFMKAGKPPS